MILTTYTWSASANGNANVAGNWTPNGVPTTGDTVQFVGNVPHECTWNLAKVSIMVIETGFTGIVKFATNCIIETGLSINEERRINPSAPVSITFNGTPAYHSNLAYVKLNCADMVAEDGLFDNLHFVYGSSTRTTIDAGKYPHMTFKAGFKTDYIAPSFTANKYNVEMKSITILGGTVTSPTSPSADDKLMNWTITSTGSHNGGSNQLNTSGSGVAFNGGAGTWTFQAKTSGFTFPVTGAPIYNNFTFQFENVIIDGTANGNGGFVGVVAGAIVRLTNLTIKSGCSMKGSDTLGATIHLVNRPTIKGTWGFLPIADGVYHYKGIYNLGVSVGGTGLQSVASGEILYGFTSQKLNTDGNFKFDDSTGTLTIGAGGVIITTGTVGSPVDNQLWVDNTSGALMFGSSAVGGGGGGSGDITEVNTNAPITGGATSGAVTLSISAASASARGTMSNTDFVKLSNIEASATADQTDAEIRAAVEAASDSNVFTDADHTKLNGIATGAEVNVQSDWNASSGDAQILNKPTIPSQYTDANAINAVQTEATLDCTGQIHFRAPVEVIATDPAPAITESGRVYAMINSGAINFTLPAGAPVGVQYVVINTLGNDITIRLTDPNEKLNGVSNGTALTTTINNGTTIVCIGDVGAPATWYVMGGI